MRKPARSGTRLVGTGIARIFSEPARGEIEVFSDFDNTMVRESTAALMVRRYLLTNPHHEPLRRRLRRAWLLAVPSLRQEHLAEYYECLRRISPAARREILREVHVDPRWLRAAREIRMRHRSKTLKLTIVTRNCIDVVHEWAMQNRGLLAKESIVIEAIVANGPLRDEDISSVRERGSLIHVRYEGFGQMLCEGKRAYLDQRAIYIGDRDDELLRPLVKEYVRL